jgi:hypothetical protein
MEVAATFAAVRNLACPFLRAVNSLLLMRRSICCEFHFGGKGCMSFGWWQTFKKPMRSPSWKEWWRKCGCSMLEVPYE